MRVPELQGGGTEAMARCARVVALDEHAEGLVAEAAATVDEDTRDRLLRDALAARAAQLRVLEGRA